MGVSTEIQKYLDPSPFPHIHSLHRTNLAQLKDAYTKLFEDYNELKEEKKKREVCLTPS